MRQQRNRRPRAADILSFAACLACLALGAWGLVLAVDVARDGIAAFSQAIQPVIFR